MTPEERLALIDRICRKAYCETESWESEDHLGAHLAYLAWAIAACDRHSHVKWDSDRHKPVLALFRQWFAANDPVWKFIRTDTSALEE